MAGFSKLASLYSELERTSSHKKIVAKLAGFFKGLTASEAGTAAYLALGTTGPKYEGTDMGLAGKFGVRALAKSYNASEERVKKLYNRKGDLGDAAYELDSRKKSSLTINEVFERLVEVRKAAGKGSQEKKISLLAELLSDASAIEAKYIMRIALGKLRLGFGEQFLIEALAKACSVGHSAIENAYNMCPDMGEIAESLKRKGKSSLSRFSIRLGRPVNSMLAKRVDTINELNERFPAEMAAEEKYDGERVQAHIGNGRITLFSRRLEDITPQFPDIAEALKKNVKAKKAVLDGEIVAYENGKILPFQKLMHRRRKYDVKEYAKKVPAIVYLFDIMYLKGRSLLNKPYPERREKLESGIKESGRVKLSKRLVTSDFSKVQDFFRNSVKKGLEGIIVKSTAKESSYQPGRRGFLWVKWKKEYAEGMRETFDLVVVGSFRGRGRRKGSFGALLCAAYNRREGRFETLTKVGTGFTDRQFSEIKKMLHEAKQKPKDVVVDERMKPDTHIRPDVVVEVLAGEITTSPSHTAGRGRAKKGYALRFPRFLRVRDDKGPEQATTVEEIRRMKGT